MQIDATSRRAPNTRKRSDTTKEKKIIAVISITVQIYCEGRLFCSDYSRLHEDHFGSGSKLKKPSQKPGSMVAKVQPEMTVRGTVYLYLL